MEFKDKVKYIRKKLLMSQTEFAKTMGVSFAAVNRWENGRAQPNYTAQKNLRDICQKNGIAFEEQDDG
jgi:DNA-binding transcriptional regulator YiaG